jgi:hypothetical protein
MLLISAGRHYYTSTMADGLPSTSLTLENIRALLKAELEPVLKAQHVIEKKLDAVALQLNAAAETQKLPL